MERICYIVPPEITVSMTAFPSAAPLVIELRNDNEDCLVLTCFDYRHEPSGDGLVLLAQVTTAGFDRPDAMHMVVALPHADLIGYVATWKKEAITKDEAPDDTIEAEFGGALES